MSPEAQRARDALERHYLAHHPAEAARSLASLPQEEAQRALGLVPGAAAARVFDRLTAERGAALLGELDTEKAGAILGSADLNVAVDLLEHSAAEKKEELLSALSEDVARELRELMSYPPDTAGSLMNPRPLALHPDTSAEEALRLLRGRRGEPIHWVFVVDPETKRLEGMAALAAIATAEPTERLATLAEPPERSIQALASREEVAEVLTDFKLPALPVVDVNGRLVGVLRHAALVEAAREDATADLQTMVGASREERALSSVSFAIKKRLPWLQVNLGTAFLAAAVVGIFEDTIARVTALAVLLPVVAGQSGNTGSQALAVVIRALALREIRVRQWRQICVKEMSVGFLNGIAVAVVCSVATLMWSRSVGLSLVIGLSMVISMMIAGLAGAAVPLVLAAVGQDPAQSSSIILTTVTDVVGFFSFLGIATAFMSIL
jgi:magnesium transporter